MDYRNDNDNNRYRETRTEEVAKKSSVGIVAIVAIIVLALAAYFLLNGKNDSASSVAQDGRNAASTIVDKVKDGAAEVPQAAKDATTDGDQKTTRPNGDNSTDKLDQK